MKKLMFAIAAFAAGVASAAITSTNVVGYDNREIVRGEFNYCVANFLSMTKDKEEMTIGDIQFNAALKSSEIQILEDGGCTMVLDWEDYPLLENDGGELLMILDFVPAATAGENGAGWYLSQDGDYAYNMNAWIVPFGWQYVVEGQDRNCGLINSGMVDPENEEFVLERGVFNYLGNCTPVEMTLGDLILNASFKSSEIQLLEDGGCTLVLDWADYPLLEDDGGELLMILDYVPAATAGKNGAGWYLSQDGDYAYNMNAWIVPAGDGFVVEGQDRGATITVPTAL